MMKDSVSSIVIGVRATDDANEWQVLTVGAGYGIQNAKTADGERDDTRTDAAGSGVAISGISSIKLVTAADVVEPRLGD